MNLIKEIHTMTSQRQLKLLSESQILLQAEKFIQEIIDCGLYSEQLTYFKYLLEQFELIYDIDLFYSDYLQAFIKLKLILDGMRYSPFQSIGSDQPTSDNYDFVLSLTPEQLQELLQQAQLCKNSIYTDIQQFQLQEVSNAKSLEEYLTKLFQHYARVLAVRVDFKYTKEAQQQINIEQFYQHFEQMRNRLSNQDTCFENLHGYAWAMEQGAENGGYHVHLLLIYSADKHRSGSYLAQQVGEKWKELTNQQGTYFNPHNKDYLNQLRMQGSEIGLGTLSRDVEGDLNKLLTVGLYLTKETKKSQRLRVKTTKGMQTFGHGTFEIDSRRGIKKG